MDQLSKALLAHESAMQAMKKSRDALLKSYTELLC
jgi:hypothetical protein